jgi:mitochondrial cardiolipin hydrolase
MDPKEFEQLLRQTLDDSHFTSSERKSLREYVSAARLNEQNRAQLRSMAFKLAREATLKGDAVRVIGWLEEVNKVLLPSATETAIYATAAFSPGDDCVNTIIGQIQAARNAMDICVFTITDNRITAAIREAHRRGVQIRIITDNEKMFDEGSDIETLEAEGVPIRLDVTEYHMHHKFALFDNKTILTGSYNWTRGAAVYNEENLIVTNDPKLVRQFGEVFEALWRQLG